MGEIYTVDNKLVHSTDCEVLTGMSTSTLFSCFSRVHGDAGIYQKIFQLNGLNQVRVADFWLLELISNKIL